MKTAVKYNKATEAITGIIHVSVDDDLALNVADGEEIVEISQEHPCVGEQLRWEIKGGNLIRKPQDVIDQEELAAKTQDALRKKIVAIRAEAPMSLWLGEINVLRQKAGLTLLTEAEMKSKIESIVKQKLKEI
mgnify:CR=1 FL=1